MKRAPINLSTQAVLALADKPIPHPYTDLSEAASAILADARAKVESRLGSILAPGLVEQLTDDLSEIEAQIIDSLRIQAGLRPKARRVA